MGVGVLACKISDVHGEVMGVGVLACKIIDVHGGLWVWGCWHVRLVMSMGGYGCGGAGTPMGLSTLISQRSGS